MVRNLNRIIIRNGVHWDAFTARVAMTLRAMYTENKRVTTIRLCLCPAYGPGGRAERLRRKFLILFFCGTLMAHLATNNHDN